MKNLRMYITPGSEQITTPQDWPSISPETLIQNYGIPSRVDFTIDPGRPQIYAMSIVFEESEFIIQYSSTEVISDDSGYLICPLTNQVDSIRVWAGYEPTYPPGDGVPLDAATDLSVDEFASLITLDPDNACIKLAADAFK